MKDTYIYPAILHYAEDGISIEFPDLPGCLPCARTTEEAIINAKEALGIHLYGMEQDNDEIPPRTEINDIVLKDNEIPLLVDVFMPPIRERAKSRFVKKTLSVPAWLNAEAEQRGVNFSQILQQGLKQYLNINE